MGVYSQSGSTYGRSTEEDLFLDTAPRTSGQLPAYPCGPARISGLSAVEAVEVA